MTKEFFDPEDFEKRSHDALSCGYYKALEEELKNLDKRIKRAKLLEVEQLKAEREDLKKENEKLKTENVELNNENAFLRHKLREAEDRHEKVKNERDDLEEENAKLVQKISCADKLLAEAADRLYQGRAHLDITAHN